MQSYREVDEAQTMGHQPARSDLTRISFYEAKYECVINHAKVDVLTINRTAGLCIYDMGGRDLTFKGSAKLLAFLKERFEKPRNDR